MKQLLRDKGRWAKTAFVLAIMATLTGPTTSFEVTFDDPSSGFFLRDATPSLYTSSMSAGNTSESETDEEGDGDDGNDDKIKPQPTTSISLGDAGKVGGGSAQLNDVLHTSSFTVVRSSRPISLTAQYGPFHSRQTVPTQYLVPDLTEEVQSKNPDDKVSRQPGFITDFNPQQIDLSAHLVTSVIPKDNPVLRVLFHAGHRKSLRNKQMVLCALLTAQLDRATKPNTSTPESTNRSISATCSPDGRDGTCLNQIVLPSGWWPSFANKNDQGKLSQKPPKVTVKITYSVYETRGPTCNSDESLRVSVAPETQFGTATLVMPQRGYRQLGKDEILHMLLPQAQVFPNTRIYVPVVLEQPRGNDDRPISAVVIRCRTKGGFRIVSVDPSSRFWTVRTEINSRGTIATVTAYKKNLQTTQGAQIDELNLEEDQENDGPNELFNWLLSLDDRDYDTGDKAKISWQIQYQRSAAKTVRNNSLLSKITPMADQPEDNEKHLEEDDLEVSTDDNNDKNRYKLTAKLAIQKDDVQVVLPIAKTTDIMNLASLTGKQISKPLKVFIVSQAGEVADVTLNSQCQSKDQSVLKVSSSCTSVYVDGSESRGGINAQVDVKYGQQVGHIFFTVWTPEFPVNIDVADTKLSQIQGWKVPMDETHQSQKSSQQNRISDSCSPRFQQTKVSVFTKFLAEDPDSGRREYYPSRGYELDITQLVTGHGLRVADTKVVSLRGNVLQGLSPGRTEVQVFSPVTGQEIGSRVIKVSKSKVQIREMRVKVLTGLNLRVQTDQVGHRSRYKVFTTFSQVLTSKYQEGLLDIDLVMSDESVIPLREINVGEYYLGVNSVEPRIIAFAPAKDAQYPRIIAVSSGQGKLLRVSLELVESCMDTTSSNVPLAVADAQVSVNILNQKKDILIEPKSDDGLNSIAVQDDQSYFGKPVTATDKYNSKYRFGSQRTHSSHMSPLEVGMVVLLIVFCAGMAVFFASCFIYGTKCQKYEYPVQTTTQSVQNARDWVWLGTGVSANQSHLGSAKANSIVGSEMNITSNPRSSELSGCDDQMVMGSTMRANSTVSRSSQRSRGHLPPPGHPVYGSAHFQENSEMVRLGPYQKSHRYHQQLLMHRPHRFLPAPPVHQSLSPVYQNSRKILEELERMQYNNLQDEEAEARLREELRYCEGGRNIIQNPMASEDFPIEMEPTEFLQSGRKPIDSSTYTKKNQDFGFENEHDRGKLILPVGYPYMVKDAPETQEDSNEISPGGNEILNYFEEHFNRCMNDPDGLPDPTDYELDPSGPLRQSPASVLPPAAVTDETNKSIGASQTSLRGEYFPMNPDINRRSPPRQGSAKIFENPFELADDEANPITVEKLSPSHIFESSTIEDEILYEESKSTEMKNISQPVFDSRTFVVKKSPSPLTPGSNRPISDHMSPNQPLWNPDFDSYPEADVKQEEEEIDAAGIDYNHLMAYFESLKESPA